MAIETDFRYNQNLENLQQENLVRDTLLGPLKAFIGDNKTRTWSGPGFNMIWRPHDKSDDNPKDFFLELDITKETLSFSDITGDGGILNRGLLQTEITLGGLAYQQEVSDVTRTPTKKLHFEPGVWINIPSTTDPAEPATVARMGSIPHGTTIHAQGRAFPSRNRRPRFNSVSITPFTIGSPDDGATDLFHFPEGGPPIAAAFPSRTPSNLAVGLDDAHFADLSKILSDVTDNQTIKSTMVFVITTEVSAPDTSQSPNPGAPHEGGGTDNIAFLTGTGNGPNAAAARMTATFWVEEVEIDGKIVLQLQYIQRVLLNFKGLSWPHVSLATMVVVDET